jgi:hypothetical protein
MEPHPGWLTPSFQTDNRRINRMPSRVRSLQYLRLLRRLGMAALGVLALVAVSTTASAGAATVTNLSAHNPTNALLPQPVPRPDFWPYLSVVETSPDCKTFEVYGANYITGDTIHVSLYDSASGLGLQVGSASVLAQNVGNYPPGWIDTTFHIYSLFWYGSDHYITAAAQDGHGSITWSNTIFCPSLF